MTDKCWRGSQRQIKVLAEKQKTDFLRFFVFTPIGGVRVYFSEQ
jgi:hypothetical protein